MSSATIETKPAEPVSLPAVPSVMPVVRKATVEEYLALERSTEIRHEYVRGEIIAMAGETPNHNRIARNICVTLQNIFVDRECESFMEGVRVRTSPVQYRYPDVAALCGEAVFDQQNPPSLLNPAVIFEVLSPSTEGVDEKAKFHEYGQIETVTDYLLVSQDSPRVFHYTRESATEWHITEYTDPANVLTLARLEVTLSLADIYRKVVFAPQTAA